MQCSKNSYFLFISVILGLLGTEGKATPIKRDPCAHFPRASVCKAQWASVRSYCKSRKTYSGLVSHLWPLLSAPQSLFIANCWHLKDNSWKRSGGYYSTISLFIQPSSHPPSLPTSQNQIRASPALILHLPESCWCCTMCAPSATLSTAEGRSLTAFRSHLVPTTYIWLRGGKILDFLLTFPFSQNASLRHPGLT